MWMEPLLTQRAQALGLARSKYIRTLAEHDLNQAKDPFETVVITEYDKYE